MRKPRRRGSRCGRLAAIVPRLQDLYDEARERDFLIPSIAAV